MLVLLYVSLGVLVGLENLTESGWFTTSIASIYIRDVCWFLYFDDVVGEEY
jgi:hypothetical protein